MEEINYDNSLLANKSPIEHSDGMTNLNLLTDGFALNAPVSRFNANNYVLFDLGANYNITHWMVRAGGSDRSNLILIDEDGIHLKSIPVTVANMNIEELDSAVQKVRYVKVENTSSTASLDISEISVWGKEEIINKSFILFNGEYKKFVEGSNFVAGKDEIPVMTGYTEPSGIVTASDEYSSGTTNAWEAFTKIVSGSDLWMTNSGITAGWLEYDFGTGNEKIICKYKLAGQSTAQDRSPKDWTFEGSNDGVNWVILDTQTNISGWSDNAYKEFAFNNDVLYQKYRINVTANNGGTYLSISELEMHSPDQPAIAPSWQTISTTLPPLDTFKSEGIDDLSVFNRKENSFTQQMTNSPLGEGKVFSTTIDLKKFIDIERLNLK